MKSALVQFFTILFLIQGSAISALAQDARVNALITMGQGQFLDRVEDQSLSLKDFSPMGVGVDISRWRFLSEIYQFKYQTGNPTLEVTTQQTHFDFSISRKMGRFWFLKPYLGASLKLFRIDTDTRIGSMIRSDSSALLYSGGALVGLDLLEVGPLLLMAELRAYKHERFEPDPSPQGLLRLAFKW